MDIMKIKMLKRKQTDFYRKWRLILVISSISSCHLFTAFYIYIYIMVKAKCNFDKKPKLLSLYFLYLHTAAQHVFRKKKTSLITAFSFLDIMISIEIAIITISAEPCTFQKYYIKNPHISLNIGPCNWDAKRNYHRLRSTLGFAVSQRTDNVHIFWSVSWFSIRELHIIFVIFLILYGQENKTKYMFHITTVAMVSIPSKTD